MSEFFKPNSSPILTIIATGNRPLADISQLYLAGNVEGIRESRANKEHDAFVSRNFIEALKVFLEKKKGSSAESVLQTVEYLKVNSELSFGEIEKSVTDNHFSGAVQRITNRADAAADGPLYRTKEGLSYERPGRKDPVAVSGDDEIIPDSPRSRR